MAMITFFALSEKKTIPKFYLYLIPTWHSVFIIICCVATNGHGQCLEINTPENIKVCSSEEGLLSATTNGTVLFSEWTPTNELTNPLSLTSPIRNPFDTTYTLKVKGFLESQNLLTNGDFSEGNMGFTSQYEYESTQPGGYIIGTVGTELFPEAKACEDHTTPEAGGNMLLVRVSETTNVDIYCQEITVARNQEYHFQGFATGLVLNSPPVIVLKVNDEIISVGTLGSFACSWQKVIGDWNSRNATTAKICLSVSPEDIGAGTDFVLDDVGFYEVCEVAKSVEVATISFSVEADDQVSLNCGDSLQLQTTVIPDDIDFLSEWRTENGHIVSGEQSLFPTINASGDYELSVLTTIDEQICRATKTVTVSYSEETELKLFKSGDFHCHQTEVQLATKDSLNPSGFKYEWSSFEGHSLADNNQPTLQINQPGTYHLQRTDATGNCTQEASIIVTTDSLQDFTVDLQLPNCDQPTGTIVFDSIIGGQAPYSYSIDNGASFFMERIFPDLTGATYQLRVKDVNECILNKSIDINSLDVIQLALPARVNILSTDRFQLPLEINVKDSFIKKIVWSPAFGLSCRDCVQPTVISNKSQTYQVVVTDQNNCITQASIQIEVKEHSDVYLPTAFSPNQDGQNDIFYVEVNASSVHKINRFHIYDRYGNMVFSRTDFLPNGTTNGWNGEYQGQLLPNGVYVYWVEVELVDGALARYNGSVGLVR